MESYLLLHFKSSKQLVALNFLSPLGFGPAAVVFAVFGAIISLFILPLTIRLFAETTLSIFVIRDDIGRMVSARTG